VESTLVSESAVISEPLSDSLLTASQPYIGRWSCLVSTTNWEKGRIIVEWRDSLASQDLPIGEYSDEAWGRLVGGVTGQHVGRLRRVYQRFSPQQDKYPGLYWSHFQAALDWADAEMWLAGARHSGWSVAQMRGQRWETLGKVEGDRPVPSDAVASETDEDFEPSRHQSPAERAIQPEYTEVTGPRYEGADFGDEPRETRSSAAAEYEPKATSPTVELIRPFESLPDVPDDLADAFDAMKLAILHHKQAGWQSISASDVLVSLDSLKALITAPSDSAPF
jgi:hypothetical protein